VDRIEREFGYFDIRVREEISVTHNEDTESWDDLESEYLKYRPRFAPNECVVSSNAEMLKDISDAGLHIWEIVNDRPRPGDYDGDLPKMVNSFFGNGTWKFLSDIEWHNTVYGNLFGSGFDIVLIREALLGNFEVDTTTIKFPLVGPVPTAPGRAAFADFNPFLMNIAEFATKLATQSNMRDGRESPSKKELINAMIDAPDDAGGIAFAQRFSVNVEWSFFDLTLNIIGDNFHSHDLMACKGRICTGFGFKPLI